MVLTTDLLDQGPNDCGKSTLLKAINNEQAKLAELLLFVPSLCKGKVTHGLELILYTAAFVGF